MNLRFIEAFVWVARLRSFRAASEKLHTTQTAISSRIASLESDFGVRLFERDKRTVTLTRSGEELLKYAEELLGISARMWRRLPIEPAMAEQSRLAPLKLSFIHGSRN